MEYIFKDKNGKNFTDKGRQEFPGTQRQRGDRHVRMKADIRGAATSQGMPGASRSWKTQGKILP